MKWIYANAIPDYHAHSFDDRTNFQLSVESNLGLFLFALFRPVICQKNLASPSRPIKCNPKTSHDSVAHVFLRFRQFGSHDPLWFISLILIGCCDYVGFVFYNSQSKSASWYKSYTDCTRQVISCTLGKRKFFQVFNIFLLKGIQSRICFIYWAI